MSVQTRMPVVMTSAADDRAAAGHASVTIAFNVTDDDLAQFMCDELFARDCCGGWLRGVEYNAAAAYGWLVYESVDKPRDGEEPQRKEAVAAWTDDYSRLPSGWYRITAEVAARAVAHGIWLYGATVLDKPRRSAALQMVLFGEIRYS